jgi:hypothetical protein
MYVRTSSLKPRIEIPLGDAVTDRVPGSSTLACAVPFPPDALAIAQYECLVPHPRQSPCCLKEPTRIMRGTKLTMNGRLL